MKRNVIIGLLAVVAFVCVALVLAIFAGYRVNCFDGVKAEEIEKVVLYYPGNVETVASRQEDIETVVQWLKSMELRPWFLESRDGAFTLHIYFLNGKRQTVAITSRDLRTNGKGYLTRQNYCDGFRKLCDELKESS